MAYDLVVSERAAKQLRRLDPVAARRLLKYLHESVAPLEDPRAVGRPLSGRFAGLWRYRVGDYRIIAHIDDDQFVVLALSFDHRSSAYR